MGSLRLLRLSIVLLSCLTLLAPLGSTADITLGRTTMQDWANVSASALDESSVLDVSAYLTVSVYVSVSAQTTNTDGSRVMVMGSSSSSGDEDWSILAERLTTSDTVGTNAVDGTEAAGQTTIEETATSGLVVNGWVFFKNSTIADSEIGYVYDVTSNTSFELMNGITNAQTGSTWYSPAEVIPFQFDCSGLDRIKVVIDNNYGDDGDEDVVNWKVMATHANAIE